MGQCWKSETSVEAEHSRGADQSEWEYENVQLAVGNVHGPCNEEQEVTSPIKTQDRD